MSKQQAEFSTSKVGPGGALAMYRQKYCSGTSFFAWLRYELSMIFLRGLPGIAGFGLRTVLYPGLFSSCGRRPAIAQNVSISNPKNIALGSKVMIDELVALDARANSAIYIGDFVSIGRGTILAAKGESIILHEGVNIGSNCRIASQTKIEIGASTLIAGYSYIGPGNHTRTEAGSYIDGEMQLKGGVSIGKHCWIGTRATILDGVQIGDGAVVGAHSLVVEDVPAGAVVAGTPARFIRMIDPSSNSNSDATDSSVE
jgi:acetyltransferase-like isoleucine patch superfamily enzyme